MTIIRHKFVDKRRQGYSQGMNSSIIHDNICSFIHKKCHSKSYHSDIKHNMTLNIINPIEKGPHLKVTLTKTNML